VNDTGKGRTIINGSSAKQLYSKSYDSDYENQGSNILFATMVDDVQLVFTWWKDVG
jgi:hypothetical protein